MLQPFFDFVEKFATDFSWRRLIILFSLVVLIGFLYYMFEYQTATSQLSKYERSIAILNNMQSIESDNYQAKIILENIRKGLIDITAKNTTELGIQISIRREFKQAIFAAAPWGLMAIFFIPSLVKRTRDDAASIVGGCLFIAFLIGLVGYFLPITWSGWIVFALYPIGINLSLFVLFAKMGGRK